MLTARWEKSSEREVHQEGQIKARGRSRRLGGRLTPGTTVEGAETCLVCQTFAHSSRGVGPQGTWVVKAGWLLSYTTSHVKMFFLSAASDTFFKTQIASLHSYLNPFHGQAGRRGAKDDHLPKAQRQAPGSEGQECGKSRARQKSEGPTPPSAGWGCWGTHTQGPEESEAEQPYAGSSSGGIVFMKQRSGQI